MKKPAAVALSVAIPIIICILVIRLSDSPIFKSRPFSTAAVSDIQSATAHPLPSTATQPDAASSDLQPQASPHTAGSSADPAACAASAQFNRAEYVIRTSVATLWRKPGIQRPVDEAGFADPMGIAAWTHQMDIPQKLWLVGKTETQALYGQPVQLLERQGDWAKIAVAEQWTPGRPEGYPGWVRANQLTGNRYSSASGCRQVDVKAPRAQLYNAPGGSRTPVEISFNTRLPKVGEEEGWTAVLTPELQTLWIKSDAVQEVTGSETSPPTGQQLIRTSKQFLGLPYLWAGVSGFGFDCSGFTYSVYRSYGIRIPRDASEQAKQGNKVERDRLQEGDLLFFAHDRGKGAVHHVAMYIGDGMMIHSPKTERTVEIIPVSTPEYAREYAGARRYLP